MAKFSPLLTKKRYSQPSQIKIKLAFFPKPLTIGGLGEILMASKVPKLKRTRAYVGPKDPETNGRPHRDIEQKLFENLCHIDCTISEIESVLNVDARTLENWCLRTYNEGFSVSYKRLSEHGKASIRRNQLRQSEKNASMAILLGKVRLKQQEPIQEKIENGDLARLLASNQSLMDQITKAQETAKLQNALKTSLSDSKTETKSELETG